MAAKYAAATVGTVVRYLPLAASGFWLATNGSNGVIETVAAATAGAKLMCLGHPAGYFESEALQWSDLAGSTLLFPLIMRSSGEQPNTGLIAVVAALILATPIFLRRSSPADDWAVNLATSVLLLLLFLCLRCSLPLALALLFWINCGRHRPRHLCKQEALFYFHTFGLILYDVLESNPADFSSMQPFSPRAAIWVAEVALVVLMTSFGLSHGFQSLLGSSRGEVAKLATFLGALCLVVSLWAWPWLTTILGMDPLSWLVTLLLEESGSTRTLLAVVGWWLVSIAVTILIGRQPSLSQQLGRTTTRKFFHLLVVVMFYPALAIPAMKAFLVLAIGGALCVFLLVEFMRVDLMPCSLQSCSNYFALFIDPSQPTCSLITSHITLLLAVGGPILLTAALAPLPSSSAESSPVERFGEELGLLTIGVGDAVAAVVGVRVGRTKWPGSNKTLEGSLAGGLAMLCASHWSWQQAVMVVLAVLAEVFVEGNDNLTVPIYAVTCFHLLHLTAQSP